jgi:serine/threonine protein kinase
MSSDKPIQWDAATRDASPEDRSRIETLREISSIASFNRVLQRLDDPRISHRAPALISENWGDLLVLEWIGTGARANVYRAWDPALERDVALKLFPPSVAPAPDKPLPGHNLSAASIRHPNLIQSHGIDHRDGRLGVWMALQRGTTLEQLVYGRGALPPSDVAKLGIDIGAALEAVHDAGLLHRNIKPTNVIQNSENRYMLAEIDVADEVSLASAPPGSAAHRTDEPFTGTRASEGTDLYALGLVLWFAAAGRHPFDRGAAGERIPAPPLRELLPDFPPVLAGLITRAIEPTPGACFEKAGQLVYALEGWRSGATRHGDPGDSIAAKRASAVARFIASLPSLWGRGRTRD